MRAIAVKVNGVERVMEGEGTRLLLEVLREEWGLCGTRYGCGEGECGACSVLVDGKREFSCSMAMEELAGKSVTTIEGLASGEKLHPVQAAFLEKGDAFQCGYCVSGMVIAAVGLLSEKPGATEAEIREGMNGNVCRCGGYGKMLEAILRAQKVMNGGGK